MEKNFTLSARSLFVRFPILLRYSLILVFSIASVYTVNAGNRLPVFSTQISISTSGQNIMISWQADKADYTYYEVQKSDNGSEFHTIGLVLDAPENSNLCIFKEKATCKNVWYRIKAFDKDGRASISGITLFECSKPEIALTTSAYPNPFNNGTTLKFNSTEAGFAQISVQNLQGKILLSKQSEIIKGENNINMEELKSLTKGVYIARLVVNGTLTGSQKLIRN